MVGELTVHTMPLETLRARAREAQRLIAQAREIARHSFDGHDGPLRPREDRDGAYDARDSEAPPSSGNGGQGADASRRVGQLLDAAQRLLPGIPSLVDERPYPSRPRSKPPESGWRRVTLRGGAERALDALERARILEDIASDAAGLVAEIERRSSSAFRAADVAPLALDDREPLTRS